jgi:hypothetical protein
LYFHQREVQDPLLVQLGHDALFVANLRSKAIAMHATCVTGPC